MFVLYFATLQEREFSGVLSSDLTLPELANLGRHTSLPGSCVYSFVHLSPLSRWILGAYQDFYRFEEDGTYLQLRLRLIYAITKGVTARLAL